MLTLAKERERVTKATAACELPDCWASSPVVAEAKLLAKAPSNRSAADRAPPRPVRRRQSVSDETMARIQVEWDGRRGTKARLARKYGVSETHVGKILRGTARKLRTDANIRDMKRLARNERSIAERAGR